MTYRGERYDFGNPNEFIENPEQRAPCVLLLDTSGSMQGNKIAQLNAGLQRFKQALSADALAMARIELAMVAFGNTAQQIQPFATLDRIAMPTLTANGGTPMGAALTLGGTIINNRVKEYRRSGVPCLKPFVFLITDGAPTDDWQPGARIVADMEKTGKLFFFPIGVEGADLKLLSSIGQRPALLLKDADFVKLFQWVALVMEIFSASRPGQNVPLPPPTWAEIRA